MVDRLFHKFGHHYILVVMLVTRLFGSIGGLLVIYYAELTFAMPDVVRLHFRVSAIIVVVIACALTVMLALWETRTLRPVLRRIFAGQPVAAELGTKAGTEAVMFVSRHHQHEAWLVPCSTLVPVLIILRVLDGASATILMNITIAVFMGTSMALMSHFFAVNYCMQPVIRLLLDRGVEIDYDALPVGRLRFRFGLCFTLIIATTALMIGTMARARASDIFHDPQNQSAALQSLIRHSTYITAAAVITGIIYSTILTKSVASRIGDLVEAMDRAGGGDLTRRIRPTGNDEVDILARRFNAMLQQLDHDHRTIRDLNVNLESRVAERTAELEATVKELRDTQRRLTEYNEQLEVARAGAEAANKAKSDFLANISHELRTPLNCVIGMNELLLDMALEPQQRKYAQTARCSGEMLLQLLNDVLDFSKIEAGMLELEHVEFILSEVIEPVIELAAYRCQGKSIELDCFIDPRIPSSLHGDPGRLRQILSNLTNNAVKFTQKGNIVVRAELAEPVDDRAWITISVQDTGIGIPEDRFNRLFQSFSQVDASTTRRFGGTGLGLAICKQLCEMVGGRIGFESQVDRGSTFHFTVPLDCPREELMAADSDSQRLVDLRALVVCKAGLSLHILCEQMRAWGLETDAASSVDEARTKLNEAIKRHHPFNLVLVDHDLTGVLPDVSASSETYRDRCSFVSLLPLGMTWDSDLLRMSGFTDCLTKPVGRSAMLDMVQRLTSPHIASPNTNRAHSTSLPRTKWTGARLLLAEDNEFNQDVAVELLTRIGYQCEVVNNGRQAVEAVKSGAYDIVIMDCHMPEMDGIEATRRIRAEAATTAGRPLPIVALTANAITGERERCLAAGMNAYLSKPLNPIKLFETIESWLNEVGVLDEIGRAASAGGDALPAGADPRDDSSSISTGLEALNYPALVNRCMGDAALAMRLIRKFQKRAESDVVEIEQAVDAGDLERAAALAHALKGASGNLSAESLHEIAARLETAARGSDLQASRCLLRELQSESERVLSAAAAYVNDLEANRLEMSTT